MCARIICIVWNTDIGYWRRLLSLIAFASIYCVAGPSLRNPHFIRIMCIVFVILYGWQDNYDDAMIVIVPGLAWPMRYIYIWAHRIFPSLSLYLCRSFLSYFDSLSWNFAYLLRQRQQSIIFFYYHNMGEFCLFGGRLNIRGAPIMMTKLGRAHNWLVDFLFVFFGRPWFITPRATCIFKNWIKAKKKRNRPAWHPTHKQTHNYIVLIAIIAV